MDASTPTQAIDRATRGTDREARGTAVEPQRAVRLLSQGDVALVGQILSSSNAIFLTRVDDGELCAFAVYKPCRGETPLWDFGHGTLCQREVAAYTVSQALGWPLIPPAVLRDGPAGSGALQLYIESDPKANYFTLREEYLSHLLPVALFDILTNNADRKGGHLLLDPRDRIWAIDNALTFHPQPKLRTVIWDFAGEPIPEEYLGDLYQLREHLACESRLGQALSALLVEEEIAMLQARLASLLESSAFPYPDPDRRQVPWPML
jgi:hypothetical protein